jgi:hypothetical protein
VASDGGAEAKAQPGGSEENILRRVGGDLLGGEGPSWRRKQDRQRSRSFGDFGETAQQEAWRERLRADVHLWHAARNSTELELKLERLKDEFAALRRGFRRRQKLVAGLSLAAAILIDCLLLVERILERILVSEGFSERGQKTCCVPVSA